ncbi:type II secretion system inner membrane protein GspF [Luteimonas sp BLCC-B24]|uniref:type II secretion system inner membrane protein GspF n=1 Tax=Luteimonas sp. BLCC-B24 TaxID=3025317 RepID=UPI00234E1040|nr:type II secretion system inner membrane protein GspF [Luteimonas sp. BLCC-B24]MDC7805686.1 type II secretion system inner membrane protein GspF [Luteimonas sp. BLCC-B24]
MPAFDYSALDLRGHTRAGTVDAATLRDARALLETRRLVPITVEPALERSPTARGGRFGARDLALLTRQLSTLVASAPLEEALRTIASQSDRRGVRRVVAATHAQVIEGRRLADAMAQQGTAFPPLYRAMVAAGERSGALPQILERLADLLERQQQVRSKMIGTLVYPAALSVTAIAVVIALMAFVVPRVVEQFDSMGRALPLLTRAVIAVSDFIQYRGWIVAILLVVGGLVFARLLGRERFRLRVDGWLLRLPLLGRMLRDLHAARMSRTLAIMLDSGLPLIEGLAITARTVGNRVLRGATGAMVTAIDEGGSLSSAMKRAGVFPPTLLYMTGSGENSGRLAPMLERAADYLEREIDTFSNATLSLLEPAIIIVLGGVVALIVLSILLPILQFNAMALG